MSLTFPYITGGTVSIANGATALTASGTQFLTEGVEAGDMLFILDDQAHPVPIGANAASNTALTLGLTWQGATQVAAPYFIMRAVDAERVMAASRAFIALYNGNNNLAVLAGLTLVADKLPYANGTGSLALTNFFAWARSMLGLTMAADKVPYGVDANTMGLMTVTAAARALLDDPDLATMQATLGVGGVVRRQVFTSSGTYTPHPKMLYCKIEVVGAGGGGGGVTGNAAYQLAGGGGGGGAYSSLVASAATVGASQAVSIGAGGAAGAAGAAGGAGGNTSVGALAVASGGLGGNGNSSVTGVGASAAGGAASSGTGTVKADGGPGGTAFYASIQTVQCGSGGGGNSVLGSGGISVGQLDGQAGKNYGGGGSGGSTKDGSAANRVGGAGAAGVAIITEFCSA